MTQPAPTEQPDTPILIDEPIAPLLNVLAEMAISLETIADNTGHADAPPVTTAQVEAAWEAMGMRVYRAEVVELVTKLIGIDE